MKSVAYDSSTKLNCGCNAAVIICLDASLTASGYPFIDGTLAFSQLSTNACGVQTYLYAVTYDQGLLADPLYSLVPGDITGIVCRGCLTTYIDTLFGGVSTTDWHILGNSGTLDTVNFIGTIDNVAHDVRVNNLRVRRSIPDANSPLIIDGYYENEITPETQSGSAILSGGADGDGGTFTPNRILNTDEAWPHYNVIVSGVSQTIQDGWECCLLSGDTNTIQESTACAIVSGYEHLIDDCTRTVILGGDHITTRTSNYCLLGPTSNSFITNTSSFSVLLGASSSTLSNTVESVLLSGYTSRIGNSPTTTYSRVLDDIIGTGREHYIQYTSYSSIINGIYNRIINPELAYSTYHIENSGNTIVGGYTNSIVGHLSTVLGGIGLKLGATSVGYQAGTIPGTYNLVKSYTQTDLTAFTDIAYFGDVDVWVGNVSNAASKLVFWEPNTDTDYSSAHSSSFEAQAQAANIIYKLPAAAGAAGQVLKIQGVVGTTVTLEWANDLT